MNNIAISPFLYVVKQTPSFAANSSDSYQKQIPKPVVKTPKKDHPVALDDVSFFFA